MSFDIALSGLNSASTELDVISHNISNAATTGFKSSRAEFADVYAAATDHKVVREPQSLKCVSPTQQAT